MQRQRFLLDTRLLGEHLFLERVAHGANVGDRRLEAQPRQVVDEIEGPTRRALVVLLGFVDLIRLVGRQVAGVHRHVGPDVRVVDEDPVHAADRVRQPVAQLGDHAGVAAVAGHGAAMGKLQQFAQVAARKRRRQRALHVTAVELALVVTPRHQPLRRRGDVVDRALEHRALEGHDLLHRELALGPDRERVQRQRLDHLEVLVEALVDVAVEFAVRQAGQRGRVLGVEQPESPGGPLAGQIAVGFLPDEGLARGRVVPAAVDRLLHVVVRDQEARGIGRVDPLDDAVVGDHHGVVVGNALRRPDRAGLAAVAFPARADAEHLEHPGLLRVADDQRLRAIAAGRQEAVGRHQLTDEGGRLARLRVALQREDHGLLDGHDLLAGVLRHHQFLALRGGRLGDRQLMLVDVRVGGVEVGVGAPRLRNAAEHLAVVLQREVRVLDAEIHRRRRALGEFLPVHHVDARVLAGVGLRNQYRAVGGGQLAGRDDGAGLRPRRGGQQGDQEGGQRDGQFHGRGAPIRNRPILTQENRIAAVGGPSGPTARP